MTEQKGFEASKYLTKLQGKDYLEVKWRLLWLRCEHPEAVVETELVKLEETFALFKATVVLPNGGTATGWGSETARDFRDFIEKAETKALGRALAALGFGTQFCEDFDFAHAPNGSSNGRAHSTENASLDIGHVVDSPIDAKRYHHAGSSAPSRTNAVDTTASTLATAAQVRAIYTIARDQYAMEERQVEEKSMSTYGCPPAELTRKQASEMITTLKNNGQR